MAVRQPPAPRRKKPPPKTTIVTDTPAKQAGRALASVQAAEAKRPPQKDPQAQPELFNLEGAINELQPEFVQCRDFGHSWRPFSARWIGKYNHYESILRCGRCETERVRFLGARGQLLGSKYEYVPGYQMVGAGRMTGRDRDMIRLASIRIVEVKDTVQE